MIDSRIRMSDEIRQRLESDSWNLAVAGSVLKERNLREEKSIFRGYVGSLAAASVFLVLFIYNVYSYMNTGTADSSESSILYSYNGETYSTSADEIDLIINEAFPMR